ncbi:MAG: hypothetical protein CMH26_00240 [Micavibrio sp.]|nr:hypothetical protein [Micavibrio sp.]|tara:strand:- start:1368 stop:2270 length:903 start_codon:yes stop_codon:yes gene_type:complete
MVDRISSFSQSQRLINNNLRIQSEYAKGQVQLSSGLKYDTYEGMSTIAGKILNLEAEISQIQARSTNAETAMSRTEMMFDAMGSMLDVANSFYADLTSAFSSLAISAGEVQTIAQSNLDQLVTLMNVEFDDRYLFSGAATKTAPIDLTGYTGGTVVPSAVDTTYYQGDSYTHSVEAAEGYTINYGVTGDNAVFEKIIRGISLVINNPGNSTAYSEALGLLNDGISELATLKASVAHDSKALDMVIESHASEMLLLENTITDLKAADLTEVATRLQELETQLEASYSVTTTLLNLKLSDYL